MIYQWKKLNSQKDTFTKKMLNLEWNIGEEHVKARMTHWQHDSSQNETSTKQDERKNTVNHTSCQ